MHNLAVWTFAPFANGIVRLLQQSAESAQAVVGEAAKAVAAEGSGGGGSSSSSSKGAAQAGVAAAGGLALVAPCF